MVVTTPIDENFGVSDWCGRVGIDGGGWPIGSFNVLFLILDLEN